MADNHVEWTSEQTIEKASSWSLAGDVALLNSLKKFSESLLSETELVNANVDNLINNLENVSLKLDLTKNEFQSLRNTQFIENRVYEDDETLENKENKKEEKELTKEEKESAIKESIVKGLKVMEQYFEKIEVAVSDSEEENDKSYILQAKDPYADRPLPYLVGSQEWYKKWHVGLLPSESESESEKEEEVYSSSNSDEGLPKDRNLGSETSSELDFSNRHAGPVANSTFNDSQGSRRDICHSSDESSDQSNSLPVKAPISNEKFAEQLAAKLGDVISGTSDNLPRVNRNPIKKMNTASKYGNLFSDEPPPLDDLEDTVLPKSAHEGLFSGGRDLFGDSEDDLFYDQSNTTSKNIKSSEEKPSLFSPPDVKPAFKVSKGLFDESDSSSEGDTSKSNPVSSKKKPVGGVSIFGDNTNIFGETSEKPGFESTQKAKSQITENIESKSTKKLKKSVKKTNLFDESSDEDIITSKNTNTQSKSKNKPANKKLNLFGETEDILSPEVQEQFTKPKEKKSLSLFDDEDQTSTFKKDNVKSLKEETKKQTLFDDENPYQNVDLFRPTSKEVSDKTKNLNKISTENKKPAKKISLFDDDDDFLKEEEDIFASVTKKTGGLFDKIAAEPKKTYESGLFEDTESDTSNANKPSKGLFDDLETKTTSLGKETAKKKSSGGLFDDLESSVSSEDLFAGSKNPGTKQKDDSIRKKTTGDLFKDIASSSSTTSLFEDSKTADIDSSRDFEGDRNKENDTKYIREKNNVYKDSSVEETKEYTSDFSKEGTFGNEKTEVKSQGASLFEGKDSSKDTEEKSEKLVDEMSDVLKVTNLIDNNDLVKKTEQDVLKESNIKEKTLENIKNSTAIHNIGSEEQDDSKISNKFATDNADNVLTQNKNDLLGKMRKTVSFLDSGNESSSDDDFGFEKKNTGNKYSPLLEQKTVEDRGNDFKDDALFKSEESNIFEPNRQEENESSKISTNISESNIIDTESLPKDDETQKTSASINYPIPPAIDLFDPTPPPLDWDAASDNSGESDTFSLTDGILNQTNLNNQSQARSSLFDEAPPSLDINDSSGIVRDMNVTRVETDDSSFYPHASSSRRLSSDIFGEQQSQDSFFLTKNRMEGSAQPGSSLEEIPENLENISSKIENLTPSGDLGNFEGSSVFESESKDSDNMDSTAPAVEIRKTHGVSSPLADSDNTDSTAPAVEIRKKQGVTPFEDVANDSRNVNISPSKISDNVRKRASLFEGNGALNKEKSIERDEATEKPVTSPIRTSPGKLQHNLKINVNALMPGAARPIFRPDVAKSTSTDEIDKSNRSSLPVGRIDLSPPLIRPVALARTTKNVNGSNKQEDDENFKSLSQTEVLHSATKDRVRIPVKRKPSSRRARQEAVRKSVTDFSLYQNEEISSIENEKSVESNNISIPASSSDQSLEPEKISQRLTSSDRSNFLKDLKIPDYVPKKETLKKDVKITEEEPKVKGISLVFNEPSGKRETKEEMVQNPVSQGLFDNLPGEIDHNPTSSQEDKIDIFSPLYPSSKSIETFKPHDTSSLSKTSEKEEPKSEPKNIFEDSFEDKPSLFKPTSKVGNNSRKPKKNTSLFGDEGSHSSDDDDDLFSSSKKSLQKDLILSTEKPMKVEEVSSKKDLISIFSDKSDSDGEGELFGGKSKVSTASTAKKVVGETSKKANIFDDSDNSGEEDLFGSKTSKSRSGCGDSSGNAGSVIGTKRIESKNVKIASVKKLENKEVTDFDPLSGFK